MRLEEGFDYMIQKLKKNLKYIKISDILSIFIFIIIFPISLVYRLILKIRKKRIWLVCESVDTASDNGFYFYKYLKENHPEIDSYYAIDLKCKDVNKVLRFGNIIPYGGLKHWLYYLSAEKNISSQKSGNPCPPVFYVLHIYNIIRNNRVFLQHGITKDDLNWLYYKETKFDLFVCGAKREYEYVKEKFGYPQTNVVYTGLARFDGLHNISVNKKQIVIMPTWRNWLGRYTNKLVQKKEQFIETEYFKHWFSVLNNDELIQYIEKNNIILYFYPHFNMQKFTNYFKSKSRNVKIVNRNSADVQELLKASSLLITDYSSVYMDFAYMQKPVLYYQFDQNEYRKKQYTEGYFSYLKDGFGPVCKDEDSLVKNIIVYAKNSFIPQEKYLKRMKSFFSLHDDKNCERIYNAIINKEGKKIVEPKLQVLVSTMNQKDFSLLEKMNIQTDAIVINQCNRFSEEKVIYKNNNVTYYNFNERGIGISRNNAILRSTGDICLFADDDVCYVDGYRQIILDEFAKRPHADIILFNVPSTNPQRKTYIISKYSKVKKFNSLRYGAVKIAVRMDRLKKENIYFTTLFGGGAKYSAGEDSLFVYECAKKGMKIYTCPKIIGYVSQQGSSWFEGYTDKFFIDRGAFFCCLSNRWAKFLGLQFAIRKYKMFSKERKLGEIIKLINKGINDFRQEGKR